MTCQLLQIWQCKMLDLNLKILLADAGYSNEFVIEYLKNIGIEGFIPNATQSRENKDALKINPVSKDNVYIDYLNKILSFALQDMCIP